MKANELRIGNYVKGKGINVHWIVEGISKDTIYSSSHDRMLSCFEAIKLNEEWITAFGFNKLGSEYSNNKYCISDNGDNYSFHQDTIVLYANCVDAEIKYVHQLQNLYFAMTGKELTINP